MDTHSDTDTWIQRMMILLGFMGMASAVGVLILVVLYQPVPDILIASGIAATIGLMRLWMPFHLI